LFEREILEEGLYPSALVLEHDHARLEWQYLSRSRRQVGTIFYLIFRGKSKGWVMSSMTDGREVLEEHQWVSRLLSHHIAAKDLLLTKPYVYDRVALEKTIEMLY